MHTRVLMTFGLVFGAAGCAACLLAHFHPALPLGAGTLFAACLFAAVTYAKEEPSLAPGEMPEMLESPVARTRTLIVGAGSVGQALARSLERRGRCRVIGFVDSEPGKADGGDWPVLGDREDVEAVVRKYAVDEVILAYAPTWQHRMMESLTVSHPEVCVRIVPTPYETLMRTGRVENLGDVAVVRLTEPQGRMWDFAKRLLDLLVSISGLILLSPVMLLAAILIKATSPGPAIFAQERVGRFGKSFTLYKFRTMVVNAESGTGPTRSTGKKDARVTPVGRIFRTFRIDEIPQLWNILRGEMSLVGPRPERPVFVEQYERMTPLYALRHEVYPGITGLAQVCGGYDTDPRDKLRFDLIYVSHRSLWLDIKILLWTARVILSSEGS